MRVRWGTALCTVLACGAGCAEFDTARTPPKRGTLGEEVYTVLCSRVGAQALPEDLTGASFRGVCAKDAQGAYAERVDAARLPKLEEGAKDRAGNAVPLSVQEQARAGAVARIEALARRRGDLVAALDAVFPDVKVAVKDVDHPDPKRSCDPPGDGKSGEGDLTRELARVLGRMTELYNDGTVPASTQALASVMQGFRGSPEAQKALEQLDARQGYRPLEIGFGATRPVLAYGRLRDLANALVGLLSADSQPYAADPPRNPLDGKRIPVPGKANPAFAKLLEVAHEELRTAKADPPAAALAIARDATAGRDVLSRPRGSLEVLRELLAAEDPAFGGGAPRYIVRRDARGFAKVALDAQGRVPAPFVDVDGDKLADVGPLGPFVTTTGAGAPSPFLTAVAESAARDAAGRALAAPGSARTLYEYIDTSHTLAAQVLTDLRPLANPDPAAKHETLMYALAGAHELFGPRKDATRCYAGGAAASCASAPDKAEVHYPAFDTAGSALVDLVHATGQVLADRSTDDTLALVQKLLVESPADVARVVGAGLEAKAIADRHPEAELKAGSTLWDEMIDALVAIAREPGLLEEVMQALAADDSADLGTIFANYMEFADRVSYDRQNLNGPAYNVTRGGAVEMGTRVDRAKPDAGFNRSAMQRFLGLIHDTHGVTACNKAGAKVLARGIPILGTAIIPSLEDKGTLERGAIKLAAGWIGVDSFRECEVFKIENLAAFYLRSIVGRARLDIREPAVRDGVIGSFGAATVDLMEQSSGITGFYGTNKDMRPKPQWLNRLVFFDQVGDPRAPTQQFLRDLNGQYIGTQACPPRTITDPRPTEAPASTDGQVHGLRSCADGDWLQQRDADTVFVGENFGFYKAMAPLIDAFARRNKEDLLLDVLEVLHRHWASAKAPAAECVLSRDPAAKVKDCARSNVVSYEPLLVEQFRADLLPALQAFVKKAQATTVKHCDALDPAKKTCTQAHDAGGVTVLAAATRALLDPDAAKANGVKTRRGGSTVKRNDGKEQPVSVLYLLLDALRAMDAALDAAPEKERKAEWRTARSQLVDQFLAVKGAKAQAAFANPIVPKVVPRLLDVLRAQLLARCPQSSTPPFAACGWAKDELTRSFEGTVGGPTFAATMDVLEAVRADAPARAELGKLLVFLLDAASRNDALPATLASVADLLQLLEDDANLTPLFHALAGATRGVDAQLALLARLTGRATDADGAEICQREIDPNQVLTVALERLVAPMEGRRQAPLEVFLDVIADVNRASPAETGKLAAADYAAISDQVSSFLTDKERGLEQFYEIVREGTKPR